MFILRPSSKRNPIRISKLTFYQDRTGDRLRDPSNVSFFVYQLLRWQSCCATKNPEEASLFL